MRVADGECDLATADGRRHFREDIRRLTASKLSSIRAVLAVALSHLVSGRAGGPWRLYYTRYYTGAAVSTSGPAGTPIRLVTKCHLAPRT